MKITKNRISMALNCAKFYLKQYEFRYAFIFSIEYFDKGWNFETEY